MPVIRACTDCERKNRVPAKYLASAGRCGACKSPLPPVAEPLAVDDVQFDEIIQNASAPEVARTAANMAGKAVVIKVDTEKYPQLAARYNVRGIPNFVVLAAGRVVMQQPGVVGHDQMEQWLRAAIPVSA